MEIENGLLTQGWREVSLRDPGELRVLEWCRQFGRLRHPQTQTRTVMVKNISEELSARSWSGG